MATDNQYKRLISALEKINKGEYKLIEDFPLKIEEYVISYDDKEYAKIIIDTEGLITLIPLRSYILKESQLKLVLNIVEKILKNE